MKKVDDFIKLVDADVSWRKKEISNMILLHDDDNSAIVIKSSLLLLYSHWEGCVKNLCKLYLVHISELKLHISDLTENYKAIAYKGKVKETLQSKDSLTLINEMNLINYIAESHKKKFKVKPGFKSSDKDKTIIDTQDNLNHKVFESFLKIIGVGDKKCLHTKTMYFDEKLLGNRNKIAHGNKVDESPDEFDLNISVLKNLKSLVFAVIDNLAIDVKSYVENDYYLAKNKLLAEKYNEKSNSSLETVIKKLSL